MKNAIRIAHKALDAYTEATKALEAARQALVDAGIESSLDAVDAGDQAVEDWRGAVGGDSTDEVAARVWAWVEVAEEEATR
jgi:hypothetical protein